MMQFNLPNISKEYLIIDTHNHLGDSLYQNLPGDTEESNINLLKEVGVKK